MNLFESSWDEKAHEVVSNSLTCLKTQKSLTHDEIASLRVKWNKSLESVRDFMDVYLKNQNKLCKKNHKRRKFKELYVIEKRNLSTK